MILITQWPIWNFLKKFLRIVHFKKSFFELPFWIFFASSLWKSVKGSWISKMGPNFDDYPDFKPKTTQLKHFCPQCCKDLFIKNWSRTVATLLLFYFDFLWISLYVDLKKCFLQSTPYSLIHTNLSKGSKHHHASKKGVAQHIIWIE